MASITIDVSERVENAKRLTREWADRTGYKRPPAEPELSLSDKANNVRRILAVSNFGCQERNVHSLCEALLGEKIPAPDRPVMNDYQSREPFVVGSILVPTARHTTERAGMVFRLSQPGNAGLRLSSGEVLNNFLQQQDVRPASDDEIDAYFAEFFGLSVNPADVPQNEGEQVELEPEF